MDEDEWRRYLADYHGSRPGITERFLAQAESDPYAWLARSLQPTRGTVLDLACGSAPVRPLLPDADWIGLDSSERELGEAARLHRGPLLRATADALPLDSGSIDAVSAALCLPVLTPLPLVLEEIRRVLRPGGMLATLVPAQSGLSPAGLLNWGRVMLALRTARQPWPNPGARDGLAALLRASGFRVQSDERQIFTLRVETPQAAGLLVDALYLPQVAHARAEAARRALARWARPGRRLQLPLRRVVARRSDSPGTAHA